MVTSKKSTWAMLAILTGMMINIPAMGAGFTSIHQYPYAVSKPPAKPPVLDSNGNPTYPSESYIGFQKQYDPNNPLTECQMGLKSDGGCAFPMTVRDGDVGWSLPNISNYRLSPNFKFYLPTGTFQVSAAGFVPQDTQYAFALRLYDEPKRTAQLTADEYAAAKLADNMLTTFTRLVNGEEIIVVHDGGGTIRMLGGAERAATMSKSGWLYIRQLQSTAGGIETFVAGVSADRKKFLSDYNTMVWDSHGDPAASASVSADNKTVTLTFNEELTNNTADQSTLQKAFTFSADGTNYSPLASGDTVKIDKALPISGGKTINGSTVTVTFATALTTKTNKLKIAANTLKDASGNILGALETSALEATPIPTFASAAVNGSSLVMTYTTATLEATKKPALAAFTVKVGSVSQTPSLVTVDAINKTVTLTLTTPAKPGEVVTVSYTDPTAGDDVNAIQDAAGNDAATIADKSVTNTTTAPDITSPIFSLATVNGSTLVMTYTDANALDPIHIPAPTAFIVKVTGVSQTPTAVVVDSTNKTVTLTLATPVKPTDVVTVSYTDPTTGNDVNAIQDVSGNDAATIPDQKVANNTPPGMQVTGKVTGTPPLQAIEGALTPAALDTGKPGAVFVLAVLPSSDAVFSMSGSGVWTPWNGQSKFPAYSTGPLVALPKIDFIPTPTDLTPYRGIQIFIGYGVTFATGTDFSNMLLNKTYDLSYTIK